MFMVMFFLVSVKVNMKAVYLKSIKSPVLAPGRFKLKYDYNPNVNVFSQVPKTEEYSEYLEDSFCVNSDYEDTGFLVDFYYQLFINKSSQSVLLSLSRTHYEPMNKRVVRP